MQLTQNRVFVKVLYECQFINFILYSPCILSLSNSFIFTICRGVQSQSVRRAEKVKIYKTLIRFVVTYGAEAWTLLKGWQFLNEKF